MIRSRSQCFEIPSCRIAMHWHHRFQEFLRATSAASKSISPWQRAQRWRQRQLDWWYRR